MDKRYSKNLIELFSKGLLALSWVFVLILTTAYAWFSFSYDAPIFVADTGKLSTSVDFMAWKYVNNVWQWSELDNIESIDLRLSEMDNLAELPLIHTFYFRLKINEAQNIELNDYIKIAEIFVRAGNTVAVGGSFSKFSDIDIDYYEEGLSFLSMNYASLTTELNPDAVPFSVDTEQILDSQNHYVALGSGIHNSNYIYLKFELSLPELQNVLRTIPTAYMPYSLNISIKLNVEVRTLE